MSSNDVSISSPTDGQQNDPNRPTRAVLCVDDEASILKSLQRLLLSHGFEVVAVDNGAAALEVLRQKDFAVIISDMRMPVMSGAEFLRQAAEIRPDTQRLLLTGYADMESTISAINQGKIQRYIQKPWRNEELMLLLQDAIEKFQLIRKNSALKDKLSHQNRRLRELNLNLEAHVHKRTRQLRHVMKELQTEHQAMLDLLFNFISVNPHLSGQFAQNVARTCRLLAAHVVPDPKDQQQIVMAGLLSQLGLLGMDPALYNKSFHLLDGTERQQFCTHPALAQLMLLPATHLAVMSDAIYHQYERYNGSGTPDRMVGTDIPVGARIINLARDFWLLVEQQGSARDEVLMHCLQQLKMHQGSYYDPVLVNIMLALQLHQLTAVESVTSAHKQISTAELQPGLVLERPLYNESRILLLPHGHVFSSASIAKLKQIEAKRDKKWLLLVSAQTKTTE